MTTTDPPTATEAMLDTTRSGVRSGDPTVIAAFVLGWRLAELYDRDSLPPPPAVHPTERPPAHLPGASEASDYDRAGVLIEHASAALRRLVPLLGDGAPTLAGVRKTLDRAPHDRADVQHAILAVHDDIRPILTAADPLLGTAYGLGRVLADTVWLPRSGNAELYHQRFDPFRLANAHAWLDDLDRAFPAGASAAVRAGLRAWETQVATLLEMAAGAAFDEGILRALHAQGELWRRLLVGERDATSLLSPQDYVAAAGGLLRRGRAVAWHFLGVWKWTVLLVLFVAGASIWAALTYAPSGTARVVAVLVSIAGALGVSSKGVSASLGRTLERAEAALWAVEVEEAVGRAATVLPDHPNRR